MDAPWLSLLPPLVAIGLALTLRKVVLSLGVAVVLGSLLSEAFSPLPALVRLSGYVTHAVTGASHLGILTFSILLGCLMGLMQRSGEQERLATFATRYATTKKRGQVATWVLGLVIFFDDYVNTLVVGSSMRPIYDRLRISREKLAFLVDATSAPVVSLAVVSSWIAVEIGYINEQYAVLGESADGLILFIESLPYRFYPWFMLAFGLFVALLGRDFGPMLSAERRASAEASATNHTLDALTRRDLDAEEPLSTQPSAAFGRDDFLAALPIVTLVLVAMMGMWLDGYLQLLGETVEPSAREVFSRSRSHVVLVGAALTGNLVAGFIAVFVRGRSLNQLNLDMLNGAKRMLLPAGVLVSAWSLSAVCRDLETAPYLVHLLRDGLSAGLLPAAVFLIAALTSFATGTSWGTMAILFPIVIPLAHGISGGEKTIMLGSLSSILAGSVWGDHCSPISDTTIMSSLASGCDHLSHVKTQLPYALVVGAVSVILGDLATGFGLLTPAASLALGTLCLALVVRFVGRPSSPHSHDS